MYQNSSEVFNTGNSEIDGIASSVSTDIGEYQLLLESGDRLLLEYYAPSSIIQESFNIESILPNIQNDDIRAEISVLDFTEKNPFGELV